MAFEIIDAEAEGVDPERAAQECRHLFDLSHTADSMPGQSQGQPENPGDPLQQACQRSIPTRTPTTDSSLQENEMKAKVNQSLDPTQIRRDFTSAKKFFLEELQAAETSSYFPNGQLFHLKERGLFDVTKGEESYGGTLNTALKIIHPSSALLSQEALSAFKLGYEYYEKFEKRRDSNGREKNIFVHEDELKNEFRTHLPDLKNLFVQDYYEERTPDTATQDHRRVTIFHISAYFELEKNPASINNLLSSFLAAFFRILADKSFEVEHLPMT